LSLSGFQPYLPKGIEELAVMNGRSFKLINQSKGRGAPNPVRSVRKRYRKPSTKRNSFHVNERNPVTLIAIRRAVKADEQTQRLDSLYRIKNRIEVFDFIQKTPALSNLLVEAYRKIEEYFGKNTQVSLDVFNDPEEPEFRMLNALITTNRTAKEARRILDRFDTEWWLEMYPRSQGYINVSLSYSS
jgi:hypothetical protein